MTMLPRTYPLPTPTAPAAFSRVGDALVVGISLHILSSRPWAYTLLGSASGRPPKALFTEKRFHP